MKKQSNIEELAAIMIWIIKATAVIGLSIIVISSFIFLLLQ